MALSSPSAARSGPPRDPPELVANARREAVAERLLLLVLLLARAEDEMATERQEMEMETERRTTSKTHRCCRENMALRLPS